MLGESSALLMKAHARRRWAGGRVACWRSRSRGFPGHAPGRAARSCRQAGPFRGGSGVAVNEDGRLLVLAGLAQHGTDVLHAQIARAHGLGCHRAASLVGRGRAAGRRGPGTVRAHVAGEHTCRYAGVQQPGEWVEQPGDAQELLGERGSCSAAACSRLMWALMRRTGNGRGPVTAGMARSAPGGEVAQPFVAPAARCAAVSGKLTRLPARRT